MSVRKKIEDEYGRSSVVVVGVKAAKQVSTTALIWALKNVVKPGDCVRLLLVIPSHASSKRFWGFPHFHNEFSREFKSGTRLDQKEYFTEICNQIMCQLHHFYDAKKVTVEMKVVYESKDGVVAAEAKKTEAQWVVLDKRMEKEANSCTEQLHCNVIVVKNSDAKILQLNLMEARTRKKPDILPHSKSTKTHLKHNVTPTSSPFRLSKSWSLDKFINLAPPSLGDYYDGSDSESESDNTFEEGLVCSACCHKSPSVGKPSPRAFTYGELEEATRGFSEANFLAEGGFGLVHRGILGNGQVVAVKQHKSGSGQGDREFWSEVEVLSSAHHPNVISLVGYCVEGRRKLLVYDYICNGSLDSHLYGRNQNPLGWEARLKIAIGTARGLRYLHEECKVGCIVHRDMRPNNILLTHDFEALIGDFGLARVQPKPRADSNTRTRITGTFGYIAPEYGQRGIVSDKVDVYAFGVVLVELLTSRKAVDIRRPKGQQCLTEWARPLLEEKGGLWRHADPWLKNRCSEKEVEPTLHCAWLCLQRDPHLRPPISQVLQILEQGDISVKCIEQTKEIQ